MAGKRKISGKPEDNGLEGLMAFAPDTYWQFDKSRGGGETNEFERRIRNAIDNGDWSKVKLPPVAFGLHGGDFLPGFKRFEVEIARLSLESTTWDVISIRARPSSRGIVYRVVDEYESNYFIRPKSSRRPLKFGELIRLLEGMTNGDASASPSAWRDSQGSLDSEQGILSVKNFVTVSSPFYSDLEPWYDREAERWVEDQLASLPERLRKARESDEADRAATVAAAEAEDPIAMTRLGCRFFFGRGVPRSQEEAVEFWKRAAKLGEPRAMFNLAVCFHDGYGLEKNEAQALSLYERLAREGYSVGLHMAGYCRHVGVGCKPNRLEALGWYFETAKRHGPLHFADYLVDCLRGGKDTDPLEREARAWIQEAASLGIAGQNMLRSLAIKGTSTPPVKHAAGIGYIGEDPLVKADST